jgi:hypothetical protein
VIGRAVLADDVLRRLLDVPVGRHPIAQVAGDVGGPVQQRQVEVAIDDHAAALRRIVQVAPGLDDAGTGVEALHQQLRRAKGRFLRHRAAGELVAGDAGQAVQEAQVVVVGGDAVALARMEAGDVAVRGLPELVGAAEFIGQPELAGPEAVGPLGVVHGGVHTALARRLGESVAEVVEIACDGGDRRDHGAVEPCLGGLLEPGLGQAFNVEELRRCRMQGLSHGWDQRDAFATSPSGSGESSG